MTEQRHAVPVPTNYEDEIHNLTKRMRARLLAFDAKRRGKSWKEDRGTRRVARIDLVSISENSIGKAAALARCAATMAMMLSESQASGVPVSKVVLDAALGQIGDDAADLANYALIILDLAEELAKDAAAPGITKE